MHERGAAVAAESRESGARLLTHNSLLMGTEMMRPLNRNVRKKERENPSIDVCANSCCNSKDYHTAGYSCECSVGSRLLARFRAKQEQGEGDFLLRAVDAAAPVAAHRCVLLARIITNYAKAVFVVFNFVPVHFRTSTQAPQYSPQLLPSRVFEGGSAV